MSVKTSLFSATSRLASLAATLLMAVSCTGETGGQGSPGPVGPTGEMGDQGAQGDSGALGELPADASTWDKLLFGVGGQSALDGLTGFTIESSGVRRISGEGHTHHAPALEVDAFDLTTHVDLAADAMRLDWNRSMLFFGGVPLTYSEIVDGDLGYVEGVDTIFGPDAATTDMPSARWAAVRKQNMLLNPHGLLAMINADPSIASSGGVALHGGVIHERLVVDAMPRPITLYVNAINGNLAKLTTMENDHLYRDIPIEVLFDDWSSDAEGEIKFPTAVYLQVNGEVWHEEYRTTVTRNPTFGSEFGFPPDAMPVYDDVAAAWGRNSHQFIQGFNSLGITQNAEQLTVVPTMLEDGVYLLGGSSHNSMAIELAASVIIAEAPLYPERSEAILAWVETTIGKPVSHLIVTHHHFDHSAGFRAFVAAGAEIVIHEGSADLIADVARRPSTIVPDTLSMNPSDLDINAVPVDSFRILSNPGGGFPGVAVPSAPTSHADDMVYVYVNSDATDSKYLFQSDLFNPSIAGPGFGLSPAVTQQFIDALARLGLNDPTSTVVGGHGEYAPLQQLIDYVNAAP